MLDHAVRMAFFIGDTGKADDDHFMLILQIHLCHRYIEFMSRFLQTVSIPFLHLIYLFCIALIVLVVMEIYKKVCYQKSGSR